MGTHNDLPRIGDSNEDSLSDAEAVATLGLVADNLEEAQNQLGQVRTGRLSFEEENQNRMHAALAQAHTLQAIGASVYLLLASRLGAERG